jgi:hypothetical protein
MKLSFGKTGNGTNRFVNKLAAEKKKTILALCLIMLMVLMWVRIFAKKTPAAAQAALVTNQTDEQEQGSSQIKISYIELPQVHGRNDVITRDFFDPNGWREFAPGGKNIIIKQQAGTSQSSIDLRAQLMQAGLKLEAIELGGNPRVFINGRLLSIGDKFALRDENNVYECEVSRIETDLVYINCGEIEIQLKLIP